MDGARFGAGGPPRRLRAASVGRLHGCGDQHPDPARRRAASRCVRHGGALRARPPFGATARGTDRPRRGTAPSHRRHRAAGRLRRRRDVGRVGVADDRAPPVPLSRPRRKPARRHRPDTGRPAHLGGRTGRPGVRPRRVLGDHVDRGGQRAGRPGRLTDLLAGARPLHPSRHHVRDLRVGAQVRRSEHHGIGLDARCGPAWPSSPSGSPTCGPRRAGLGTVPATGDAALGATAAAPPR